MKHYIYTLTHPVSGEIRYIGKTNNVNHRLARHKIVKGHTHKENWIKSLLNQNLSPLIEILEEYDDEQLCNQAEIYWIEQFKQWNFRLTNSTIGGEGTTGRVVPQDLRDKLSDTLKERYQNQVHHLKGTTLSDEHKSKLSKSRKGRPATNGFKGKIHPKRKLVAIFKDGVEIEQILGLQQLCDKYQLDYGNAYNCANGKTKSVKGYQLQFV